MRRFPIVFLGSLVLMTAADLTLPQKAGSVRFAVIGDNGTGEKPQYELADQMARHRHEFRFDFVLMLGDNIYGGEGASGFKRKFEQPYRSLLEDGVKFYASLGNHDNSNERLYKPFNMEGRRYYTFKKGNAEFFALDSSYMDPEQISWLEKQLAQSQATWKICFFHHPLYSHGRDHPPAFELRKLLEPIFLANHVNVVFSGHEHSYERLKPQKGISYFVLGNSGQLRYGNLKPSPDTAKGFDTDRAFGIVEISGDELYFQVIARTGETVDSGTIDARFKFGS